MKISNKKIDLAILTLFVAVNFLTPVFIKAQDGQGATDEELVQQFDPEIQRLKEEIQSYQDQLDELTKQTSAYENSIRAKRQEITNLNNQTAILEDSIAKTALEIQTIELKVEKTNLEIENIQLEIDNKHEEIVNQQEKMSDIIRTVDKLDRKKSYLEVLVLKGDIGSFFKEVNELQLVEEGLTENLQVLRELENQLNTKKDNLEKRRAQLDSLKGQILTTQEKLEIDKGVKNQLLTQTKGQENSFQQLLSQVKAEQAQINAEIQNLEVEARKKLLDNQGLLPQDDGFIWPVPSRKVTAYFHDPDYPFRYIFEHPAVDVGSTPQGTPIRAARSGYVARVSFDGTSRYSYIMIVHTGGLSTVYGHISKPYVTEDDFVVQGEVIALSGGNPGSPGSGNLTTAAHLHFEVRLNGIPVDPLNYLP